MSNPMFRSQFQRPPSAPQLLLRPTRIPLHPATAVDPKDPTAPFHIGQELAGC